MTEKINSLNLVNFVLRVKSKYIETEINRLLQDLESLKAENSELVEKYEKSEDRLTAKIMKNIEKLHNEIDRSDDSEHAMQSQEIFMKI